MGPLMRTEALWALAAAALPLPKTATSAAVAMTSAPAIAGRTRERLPTPRCLVKRLLMLGDSLSARVKRKRVGVGGSRASGS